MSNTSCQNVSVTFKYFKLFSITSHISIAIHAVTYVLLVELFEQYVMLDSFKQFIPYFKRFSFLYVFN